ncbi:MAG: hypothetical protein VW373_04050 [Halieaceae bacterium]
MALVPSIFFSVIAGVSVVACLGLAIPEVVICQISVTANQGRRCGLSVQEIKRSGTKKPTEVGLK